MLSLSVHHLIRIDSAHKNALDIAPTMTTALLLLCV